MPILLLFLEAARLIYDLETFIVLLRKSKALAILSNISIAHRQLIKKEG